MNSSGIEKNTAPTAVAKPHLSIGSIINLSMGFMGIQMGFGLQNGNASRILANFGADVHHLSWFWLVAPLTGLIVQPIIGHMGDNTWGRMGRRKPYFLVGAILAALGLMFLPNSSIIAGDGMNATEFMGISAILWISIGFLALMDASFNISMEPFRALVGDMLPKSQGTIGFSVQTILISLGAIIGSFMPWILTNWFGVSNTADDGMVAPNVIGSFYVGAAVLMTTILYTIATVKEYSPADFARYNGEPEKSAKSKMSDIFIDVVNMPVRMKRLGLVQFFSWFALFTMWVYTTSAIATHHYGLTPDDTNGSIFNTAADQTGALFGWYNFFALIFAFLLSPIAKRTSRKFVHILALTCGGVGLLSMYFIT
ncbi:MAG: MFS transporter, partial [Salibacteraceae bacterium]|nr:MFS transporter [Salibacteraceae bacterium]